jgi:hypothetical protein
MMRLYVIGIVILIVAILANGIAIRLGFKTWYDLIDLLNSDGLAAMKALSFLDYLWLFIAYPLSLGAAYWLGDRFYSLF